MKTDMIQQTQSVLNLIAKRDLDDDGESRLEYLASSNASFATEKKQLINETVDNFNEYINPGFLKYRKSFSPDYVAGKFSPSRSSSPLPLPSLLLVEWADSGSTFTCVKGIEYIDCLGGYGIYK